MNRPRAFSLILVVASLAACSTNDLSAEWQAAIVAGEPDAAHPEVVAVGSRRGRCEEEFSSFCTGTLISSDVVLTAAHCFDEKRPGSVYEVWLAGDEERSATARYVDGLALHPAFDPVTHDADLALLHLAEPVIDIAPARIRRRDERAAGDLTAGEMVEIVGYGGSESSSLGPVKRRGLARVSAVAPDAFEIVPAPSMTCDGDSGGPAFAIDDRGSELIGVTSWGDPGCQDFGLEIRPDSYWSDFIAPFMADSRPSIRPSLTEAGALCAMSCASADECPSGFECAATGDGSRCAISAPVVGNYEGACTRDSQCGSGYCGRTHAQAEPGACACLSACSSPPRGSLSGARPDTRKPDEAAGCSLSHSRSTNLPACLLLPLLCLGRIRRTGSITKRGWTCD